MDSNGFKYHTGIAGDGGWSAKTTEVNSPGLTFILTERVGPRFLGYPYHAGMSNPNNHHVIKDGTYIHDIENYNYLYADGHVEYLHYLEPVTTSDGASIHIRNSSWNYQR